MRIDKVLIVGLGLMGGSMGRDFMALRAQKRSNVHVTGVVRSQKSKTQAISEGLADEVYTAAEFQDKYADYDWIVLAVPVAFSLEILKKIPPLKPGAVVLDVGSTKHDLLELYVSEKLYEKFNFIACHPMAGSELSGPLAAFSGLYKGKLCFICESHKASGLTDPQAMEKLSHAFWRVKSFWETLGSICFAVIPHQHDEAVAYLSHAPHLISALLTHWAANNQAVHQLTDNSPIAITGGGFKDMVRIAGSNPQMWQEIIETNQANILASLKEFKNQLQSVIDLVENEPPEKWYDFIEQAHAHKLFLTQKIQNK